MRSIPLNLLILEDQPADAELMVIELRRAGFDPQWKCVQNESDYLENLAPNLDLILSDYSLPGFTALQALQLLREQHLEIPFIVVTGTISDEMAVECMKQGVADYLTQDRLAQLGQAVAQALEQRRLRLEKQQAELHLRESEERFRRLAENARDIIFRYRLSPTPGFEYISPAVHPITGYTPEELYAHPDLVLKIVHPDDRKTLNKIFPDGDYQGQSFVLRCLNKNGMTIWTETSNAPVYDQSGHLIAIEGISRNITESKQTEELIIRAKREWEHTFDSVSDLIFITDTGYIIRRVNRAMAEHLGVSPKDLIGLRCHKYVHGLEEPPQFCCVRHLHNGREHLLELEEKQLGGDFLFSISPLHSNDGKLIGYIHVCHDITEMKRTAKALQESEERYRTLFEQSRDAIFIGSIDGKIVDVNQSALDLFGYSRDEMLDLDDKYLYAVSLDRRSFRHEIVKKGFVRDYEVKLRKKGGAEMDCLLTSTLRRGSDGRILGYQGIIRDITDRKRDEVKLKETFEKLQKAMEGTIQAMSLFLELRDPYTAGHQKRVSQLAYAIAKEMNMDEEEREGVRLAGLIHDIGKIIVPAEILNRPGRMSEVEFNVIKAHPQASYDILQQIEFPWPIALTIFQHHERLNGSGYPLGISREDICLEAKILSVADVVEAMASHRPYRPALGIEKALKEISQYRGILYESSVVDACLKLFTEQSFIFE